MSVLARYLRSRLGQLEVVNEGAMGSHLEELVKSWPEVAKLNPSLVTVLPFSDYARTPMPQFKALCEALLSQVMGYASEREAPFCLFFGDLEIDPAYISRPDLDGPSYRPEDFAMLTEKNAAVAALAGRSRAIVRVPVVDQNAIHPEWIGARGHPNDLGHGYLAGCFRGAIEAWLREL